MGELNSCLLFWGVLVFAFSASLDASGWPLLVSGDTNHTMISLLDRNYKCVLNITNLGNQTDSVSVQTRGTSSSEVMVLGGANLYLGPNETAQTIFIIEMSNYGDGNVFTMNASISASPENEVIVPITVLFREVSLESLPRDANLSGYVYDNETRKPIAGADIRIEPWSAIWSEEKQSDPSGGYNFSLVSTDYLDGLMSNYSCRGKRGYYLKVSADGYESFYESGLSFHGGEPTTGNFYLSPLKKKATYSRAWDREIDYSVWRIPVTSDWDYFAVAPGQHPQGEWVAHKTYMYLFNRNGTQVWNYSVNDELWGADISRDGKYIAAGAHQGDNHIYLWNTSGSLLWDYYAGGPARVVKFTNDGKYLGSGPGPCGAGCFELFNSSSGEIVWTYNTADWVRTIEFSKDNAYAAFGSCDGYVYLTGINGSYKWKRFHGGYVPFLTEMSDNLSSIAVAGKGHEIIVYDADGNLKWDYPTEQVITAGAMTPDGSRIAVGTVAGYVYFFDGEGSLLWRTHIGSGISVGHNAVKLTDNGKYLVIGTGDRTMLFDEKGTVLWEYQHYYPEGTPMHPFASGAIYVDIDENATRIVSGTALHHVYYFTGGIENTSGTECELAGDYPPCGTVSLSEVVSYINLWSGGEAMLSEVVALINKWAA